MTRPQGLAVAGHRHRQGAEAIEPLGHALGETVADVLGDEHRGRQPGGERRQQPGQGLGPAGGDGDGDHRAAGAAPAGAGRHHRGGGSGFRQAAQVADHRHPGQHPQSGGEGRSVVQGGFEGGVQGAPGHGGHGVGGIRRVRDHQDAGGALVHDLRDGLQAIHFRHPQIHGHQVRPQGLGQADRGPPILGLAADRQAGVPRDEGADQVPGGGAVIHHQDLDGTGARGRHRDGSGGASSAVSRKRSTWSLRLAERPVMSWVMAAMRRTDSAVSALAVTISRRATTT